MNFKTPIPDCFEPNKMNILGCHYAIQFITKCYLISKERRKGRIGAGRFRKKLPQQPSRGQELPVTQQKNIELLFSSRKIFESTDKTIEIFI